MKTLKDLKLRVKKNSDWYKDGYTGKVTFCDDLISLKHPKLGVFAYIPLNEVEILEDNPVASIDNLKKIANDYISGIGMLAPITDNDKLNIYNFINYIETKLQNAVETDKEEPIKSYTPNKLGTLIAEIQGGLKQKIELKEAMKFLEENGITEL